MATSQLATALNETSQEISIQLYPHKLTKGNIATSDIILQVPKTDLMEVATHFAKLKPGALGNQVDFVPYSLIQQTAHNSFHPLFSVQNKYIEDMGVISIHGLPLSVTETPYGN